MTEVERLKQRLLDDQLRLYGIEAFWRYKEIEQPVRGLFYDWRHSVQPAAKDSQLELSESVQHFVMRTADVVGNSGDLINIQGTLYRVLAFQALSDSVRTLIPLQQDAFKHQSWR